MKKNDLNLPGLHPLTDDDLMHTNGGGLPKWVKGFTWAALLKDAFDHWDDIKAGFADGYRYPSKH